MGEGVAAEIFLNVELAKQPQQPKQPNNPSDRNDVVFLLENVNQLVDVLSTERAFEYPYLHN